MVVGPDGEDLNGEDAWSIVDSAIVAIVRKDNGGKTIDPARLLKEADERAACFFRQKPSDYVLVTSLSVNQFPAKCLRVDNCKISPIADRRKYPYPEALQRAASANGPEIHIESTTYQAVRVASQGRTVHEAVHKALGALNYLRGLWNLLSTYGSWSIGFGQWKPKPIGLIHLGRFHTLHRPDRTCVGDSYWYEPDYVSDLKLFHPAKGWDHIEKNRRWAMRRITNLPYARDMTELLRQYVTPLDSRNSDIAFLHMWGLLERITDTVGSNYDKTISRAVRVFADRDVAKDMLKVLRCWRNRYVHAAQSGGDRDQIAYMLKSFVNPHLIRLIHNDFGVESLKEYAQCLSLPVDRKQLKKQERWIREALRWAGGG